MDKKPSNNYLFTLTEDHPKAEVDVTVYASRDLAELDCKVYVWQNWDEVFSQDETDSDNDNYRIRPDSPDKLTMADVCAFERQSWVGDRPHTFVIKRTKVHHKCLQQIDNVKEVLIDPIAWCDIEPSEEKEDCYDLLLKGIDMEELAKELKLLNSVSNHVIHCDDRLSILDLLGEVINKFRQEYGAAESEG